MHLKSKHWLLLFGIILLVCIASVFLLHAYQPKALVAEIYQDGALVRTIDLTALNDPQEILLTNGEKENRILAENGQILMHSANCPDRLCVRQGPIQNGIYPIVCLPNKVVIKLVSNKDSAVDAVTN